MNASPSSIPSRTAACAIIKHANPCGVAEAGSLAAAYRQALACDPVSAFGGIVALNRTLDAEAARAITEIFTEVIIAPDATEEAIAIVGAKKNLRLLLAGGLPDPRAGGLTAKTVAGGLLVQSRDNAVIDDMELKAVTKRAPTNAELRDLRFAFRVAKHVKSNTIVYAKDSATVGIGAGQMSRIDSARIAARKAEDAAQRSQTQGAGNQGLGGRLRRVLSVCRRIAGRHRSRRHRRYSAGRLSARRRGDQGRRRPWHRHGVHRRPAFSALGPLFADPLLVFGNQLRRPFLRQRRPENHMHPADAGEMQRLGHPAAEIDVAAANERAAVVNDDFRKVFAVGHDEAGAERKRLCATVIPSGSNFRPVATRVPCQ